MPVVLVAQLLPLLPPPLLLPQPLQWALAASPCLLLAPLLPHIRRRKQSGRRRRTRTRRPRPRRKRRCNCSRSRRLSHKCNRRRTHSLSRRCNRMCTHRLSRRHRHNPCCRHMDCFRGRPRGRRRCSHRREGRPSRSRSRCSLYRSRRSRAKPPAPELQPFRHGRRHLCAPARMRANFAPPSLLARRLGTHLHHTRAPRLPGQP